MSLECKKGDVVEVVRANFGRFSLEVCNPGGHTEWDQNCILQRTKTTLDTQCYHQQNCPQHFLLLWTRHIVPVASLEHFRALKCSRLEHFRALKNPEF